MKKIILLYITIISSLYPQTQKLTLQESIELGLNNSKDLRITQSKLKSSDAKVSEVNSMFFPQLKFTANYTRLSDNVPPFEVTTPFSPVPIKISEPVLNNYYLRLSLQQPLFTGLKLLSSKKAADYNFNAAESDYSKEMNETAMNIHSLFWNYYRANEIRNLLKKSLGQIENHLKDTKNYLDNGLTTQNDYLKLQVQYSNTQLQLIEAENNLEVTRAMFNKALGLPLEAKTEIVTDELEVQNINYNSDELIKEAKINRDEIESLSYKLKAAEESIASARSGWFPSVYLSGNYYYSNPNTRFQPLSDKWNDTWDVGVTLSWDVWDWGITSSKTTQAEELSVQTKALLEKLTDNIEIEVYKSYLNLIKSKEKVDVSKLSLNQASENYRITSEKYKEQLATSTDLIDAEISELQAATNLTSSLIEYHLAKVKLHLVIGRRIY
ncbi:MAG: TolC family protein [Ignavibacteriota bacterium]|nr:TolC family protein [Ignavibacteriota bacterium]MCO6447726.1 TolC family protein [Ignavibacterium album]MCZ2267911.1 TolC family protein [Ignavibacteriales bacterium]QKK00136.1 MAG: TolC family protein [Ignavibacteriota bacterium]HOJ06429.1 TolC family protein [Ignavibacteriaceae bacterium]